MSLQLTGCMKVAATSYLLTLNEKKIIPQHLLCNREKEKYICSAFSPWCCSYKSYMSIKPVWGLTSFHLFFPSLLRHEEPPLPSLVCLFDMVGLEPVSGLVENKPCVFDLGFWMPQLFHSHQTDWAKAPGSPSNMARTWPWIVAGLLGFNLEMLLIQLANLPLAAFLCGLPLKWIPQPIN